MSLVRLLSLLTVMALIIAACGDSATSPKPFSGSTTVDDDAGVSDAANDVQTHTPLPTFSVGGIVTGLQGSGLVLQNNGGDDLPITGDGTFAFPTKVASGAMFTVSVKTQPIGPVQHCTVSGGTGVIANGDVTTVVVDCTVTRFSLGGTVSGLVGPGLVLQKNNDEPIVVNANGSFAFPPVLAGSPYRITIKSQPLNPRQTCTVANGEGSAHDHVTNIEVTCTTNRYTIGGVVLGAGSGLVLALSNGGVLLLNGSGPFTFPTPVPSGSHFHVTIQSQPSSPSQTCQVVGGDGVVGAANITSVVVNCFTNRYTIGGTVSGALAPLVLQNNGADDLTIATGGTASQFAFPTTVASGEGYAVTVKSHPAFPKQTCTVTNGAGTVGSTSVTDIGITCDTHRFKVKATVSGLDGTGLKLKNGPDEIAITTDGTYEFPTTVASGDTYTVTTTGKPTDRSQTCTVSNGAGIVVDGDITDVAVTCVTDSFTVGGTVSGLTGSGLVLQNKGGDDLPISAPGGEFTFSTKIPSGEGYDVTVKTPPSGPSQTCTVSGGIGTVTNGNVLGVVVNCSVDSFTVSAEVSGLVGSGLVLQNNGGDDLPVNGNGTVAFPPVPSGEPYSVTVKTHPTGPHQTCEVTNGGGTVTSGPISNVLVECRTNTYTISGTIAGLTGGTITLLNNGADALSRTVNGPFTFATSVPSGGAYAVTIGDRPTGLSCSVTNGSGPVVDANITDVTVTCSPIYMFTGIRNNVPVADLVGWTECYRDLYSNDTGRLAQDILAACTKPNILLACRATGSATLRVLAHAPRADVFFDTGDANHVVHDANGVGWYFSTNWSMGFAPLGAAIYRYEADRLEPSANDRLSWHTREVETGGWRCGDQLGLNESNGWERLVYHAD